ncbi:hypothetical protein BDV59DRAFT_199487 [Aspergillus ambiguus]|uniref:sulfotransferase family protein n=1 Tax=Aspergillus ambiguus TaxID=176160 RepID=UPI003CCDB5BC
MAYVPFAPGAPRPKKVISLSFYRTGSLSLKTALTTLGYQNVFHVMDMADSLDKWAGLDAAVNDNIACIPSYTGRTWTRRELDTYFGACEAITDIPQLMEPLLREYPEARVILVHRDFDAWVKSFEETLLHPSSGGFLAWLSGTLLEPLLGLRVSQINWNLHMGLLGVCDLRLARDRAVLRAAYRRHYDAVRRLVPPERLLEIDLKDLRWEPLCEFLGKEVPDVPFPRLNESRVFQAWFRNFHRYTLKAGLLKLLVPVVGVVSVAILGLWVMRMRGSI